MSPDILAALQASIEAWEKKAKATDYHSIRLGTDGCPLCQLLFDKDHPDGICGGCPVFERSGEDNCRKTPYGAVRVARYDWYDAINAANRKATARAIAAFQTAARDEVAFLKSLLPETTNAPS
jgi:hypothetical protein